MKRRLFPRDKYATAVVEELERMAQNLKDNRPVKSSTVIGIRVDDELYTNIKTRADELKVTPSALCWTIVSRAMASKRKVNAPPRPVGFAAMSPETARRVKSDGGKAKHRAKPTTRKDS